MQISFDALPFNFVGVYDCPSRANQVGDLFGIFVLMRNMFLAPTEHHLKIITLKQFKLG